MTRAAQIEETAARWIVRREEPGWSDDEQIALDDWLARDVAHKAAFWRLEHGWREADRIAAIGDATPTPVPARAPLARRILAAAASLALAVGLGALLIPDRREPQPVAAVAAQTDVGGRRLLGLEDGSRVELNTASRLRTVLADRRREVWLDRGEAYFEVAHDPARPFTVHAGTSRVTVLGTKFAVRRDAGRVTVSVAEGRVRVEDTAPGAASRATIITAGDVAIMRDAVMLVAPRSEERVEDGLAWRDGMLRFDQDTLGDVAAEFNRYNRRRIVVADPAVAAIRVGGSFQARNIDGFLRLLQDAYGLRVQHTGDEVKISA